MNVTSIHLKILKCLESDNYSLKELSLILGISEAMLRRNIKEIEDIFYFKNFFINNKKKIKNISLFKKNQDFLIEERKMYLIIKFLFNENINLTELSIDLKVTRRTVANDIKKLKTELKYFDLEIESTNSIGVKLIGEEIKKRELFNLYILKFLRDIDYLPQDLKILLNEIKKIIDSKGINKIVKYIVDNLEMPCSGLLMRSFEVMLATAFFRKDFIDNITEITSINIPHVTNTLIEESLKNIDFITKYEKYIILHWCSQRNYEYIIKMDPACIYQMKKLLQLINLEFTTNFILDKPLLIKLYSILKSYNFKQKFNIKEFYLYNKNLSETYEVMFLKIKNIILNELKGIDSFDLMVISTIFLELLTLNVTSKTQELTNIAIVYNFLNPLIIDDLCKKLSINNIINNSNYVYINHLNDYLKMNTTNSLIVFEEIDLSMYDLKTLRLTLPLSFEDVLKFEAIHYD
ncbi:MAG: HTH domain-containing protein [Cetobacterium sp.]